MRERPGIDDAHTLSILDNATDETRESHERTHRTLLPPRSQDVHTPRVRVSTMTSHTQTLTAQEIRAYGRAAEVWTEFIVSTIVSVVLAGVLLVLAITAITAAWYILLIALAAAPVLSIALRSFSPISWILSALQGVFWLGTSPLLVVFNIVGKRRGGGR